MAREVPLFAIVFVSWILAFTVAEAEERKLTAPEIADVLTGNTVDGIWNASPYRSYFDPGGYALYQRKDLPVDQGKWRVDAEKNQYCSWWARSGWSCYDIYQDGDTIIWSRPDSDRRHPSTLLPGQQLDAN